jgi:hypothetical protein
MNTTMHKITNINVHEKVFGIYIDIDWTRRSSFWAVNEYFYIFWKLFDMGVKMMVLKKMVSFFVLTQFGHKD